MKTLLCFIIFSLNAHALSEKDVIDSVLKHFPLIQEAEEKVASAEAELTSAEGAFDHKLVFKSRNRIEDKYDNQYFETVLQRQTALAGMELIAGHRQGLGRFAAYDGKNQTSSAGEIFAGLSLPILRNFQTDEFRTQLKIKEFEKQQSIDELKLKKMIYLHKALSLYYKWILETQKLKINKSIFELAKNRHSMIEKKFNAGDIERLKVVDNQRAIDKRASEIFKIEIELSKVSSLLSIYLRDANGQSLSLPLESNPEYLLQKNETVLHINHIENNPQIKILKLEKEKIKAELNFYDQSKLPGLNLELLGAKELSNNRPYDPQSLQVGIKFDFPLENNKAEGKQVAYFHKVMAIDKTILNTQNELSLQFNFFKKASEDSKQRWEIITQEYEGTNKMYQAEQKKMASRSK